MNNHVFQAGKAASRPLVYTKVQTKHIYEFGFNLSILSKVNKFIKLLDDIY